MFAEFPAVPTAPVCVPVAVVIELVVDHIELGSKSFSQVRVPTLTVGQPRMGSVRGDAHHTIASSISTREARRQRKVAVLDASQVADLPL